MAVVAAANSPQRTVSTAVSRLVAYSSRTRTAMAGGGCVGVGAAELAEGAMGDPPGPMGVGTGTAVRGAPPLREEVVRPQRTIRKRAIRKGGYHPFLLSFYSAQGGLPQALGRVVQSPTEASNPWTWDQQHASVVVDGCVARVA